MVKALLSIASQQLYRLISNHLVSQLEVVFAHWVKFDRLEVAIDLRILQRVVVDDLAFKSLVVLSEWRSRELKARLLFERGLHPTPRHGGHMVRFIDDQVAAELSQGLQGICVKVLQRLRGSDNYIRLGKLLYIFSRHS
ncbi:hypothetical protein D3C81_1804890 [compost metagenome]